MELKNLFNEKEALVYIFLIAVVVLSSPLIARAYTSGNYPAGYEPYYHEKSAREIIGNGFHFSQDDLKDGLYHPILAAAGFFIGVRPAASLIPFLMGVSSLVVFYLLLKKLNIELKIRMAAAVIAAISPPFTYTFANSNPYSVSIFLTLLGMYLMITGKKEAMIASVLLFIAAIPGGFLPAAVIVISLMLYYFSVKDKTNTPLAAAIVVGVAAILYNIIVPQETGVNIGMRLLVDFGSIEGFGLFTLILSAIGFYALWNKKGELFPIYSFMVLLISASIFFPSANLYLNFIIAIYAAAGFILLAESRWDLEIIKNLTLILVVCGLVFSTISYGVRFVNSEPSKEMTYSLEWLKTKPDGGVLSQAKNGFWIEAISEKGAVIDGFTKSSGIINDTSNIFRLRNVDKVKPLLDKYDVRYIWIDRNMKQTIWKKEDEGLLFVFRDTKTFKNIYRSNEVEIWEYTKAQGQK